jgi:hypothetical protein
MARRNATTKVEGMDDLKRALKKLEKLPQSVITQSVRKGATYILKKTVANAPEFTGTLKAGIVVKGERKGKRGRKVYQITFNKNFNDYFVKYSSGLPDKGFRAYYPASQEYGFRTPRNGGYVHGLYFMREAADANSEEAKKLLVYTMMKKVEKIWQKGR